jgi:hypothetical protein
VFNDVFYLSSFLYLIFKVHQRYNLTKSENGGAKRDRTADLLLARQALSQLSYSPIMRREYGGPRLTRTADLTLIRRAL